MGGLVFLAILCSVPLYVRTFIAVRNPLAVDASGARFAGRYRSWQISALTGRIAGANTYSTTKSDVTYGTVQSEYRTHRVVTGVRTSTSVHNTLLLVDKAGQQHSLTLTNFGLEVFNDQMVSVCQAVRGRKQVIIAVLNHSTQRLFTRKQAFNKILYPHGQLLGFWLAGWVLLALPVALVLGFLGYPVFCVIVILSAVITNRAANRQFRRFTSSGIGPLWTSTAATI